MYTSAYNTLKMDCRLVNPGFRRLLVGAESINYQNTVAVRMHTAGTAGQEECWLGYIQDIRDEHVLVDFDARRAGAAARYMHASHVWPLPLMSLDMHFSESHNMPVFVALRDHYDGPFRFRPATVLYFDCECRMYFISTNLNLSRKNHAAASGNGNDIAVVDWCQIMSRLPFAEPPLLARTTTGVLYTRHEILLNANARTQCVFNTRTTADASQLIDSFRQVYPIQPSAALAGAGMLAYKRMEENCRFHLRIGPDPHRCTFIVVDAASRDWTGAALQRILERYATCRTAATGLSSSQATSITSHQTADNQLLQLSPGYPRCMRTESGRGSTDKEAIDAGTPGSAEATLRRLPLVLLTEILEVLDLHSQAHAIRVCALWQAILGDPRTAQHISVLADNLQSTSTQCGDHNYCCRFAMLLSRVITPKTRSVTLIARAHDWEGDPFNWHMLWYVEKLLEVMRIQLPFLVLKSFCLMSPEPNLLLRFLDHCDQLMLDGLEMRGTDLFIEMRGELQNWRQPNQEKRFINKCRSCWDFGSHSNSLVLGHVQQPSVLDATLIIIPRFICHWRDADDWEPVRRRFMWAMERAFPPASAAVHAKVAAVHARWCRSLPYPDDWYHIRRFINKYSGFHPDGSRHAYARDDADLRSVDIRQLSNMALWGIAEVYNG
ncbi:uncharacterized protein LOC129591042 isoform X2 [Paramacrobiotus metropolitanus]|uniref:uncharacterized protein LOC129591042 isoform X2 n=1 Tax=Paramacrobiotus metropolitanus TaxID=2943436 RepID=UPI002445A1D5|nr:uncharacterized protein LOC129591042 isoform X2 [Paramacrobiotus metropolitanus]